MRPKLSWIEEIFPGYSILLGSVYCIVMKTIKGKPRRWKWDDFDTMGWKIIKTHDFFFSALGSC